MRCEVKYKVNNPIFMENTTEKPVILFDGVCNLCNGAVQFIINRDDKAKFMFASLQSDFGQQLLEKHNLNKTDFDSFILMENNIIYKKSTAALRMFSGLGGLWKLSYGLFIFPEFIRNFVYDFVAKNRYRFFGKKDACMIPTPALKARFFK